MRRSGDRPMRRSLPCAPCPPDLKVIAMSHNLDFVVGVRGNRHAQRRGDEGRGAANHLLELDTLAAIGDFEGAAVLGILIAEELCEDSAPGEVHRAPESEIRPSSFGSDEPAR